MKRLDILPLLLLLPVVGFVAWQTTQSARVTSTTQAASLEPAARVAGSRLAKKPIAASAAGELLAGAEAGRADRDLNDVRRRLQLGEQGTYISEILRARDSALARWPERVARPVRVWIGRGAHLADWNDSHVDRVREAFDEWALLGIPVRFTFVLDSADADVRVRWIDHFDTPISGKTLWARDRNWWIVNGNITLALHHNGGDALDGRAIRAIALHEVGHLLGLDHTIDTANIMTARVRVRELSEADRATMLLLYSLPPGSVKG